MCNTCAVHKMIRQYYRFRSLLIVRERERALHTLCNAHSTVLNVNLFVPYKPTLKENPITCNTPRCRLQTNQLVHVHDDYSICVVVVVIILEPIISWWAWAEQEASRECFSSVSLPSSFSLTLVRIFSLRILLKALRIQSC